MEIISIMILHVCNVLKLFILSGMVCLLTEDINIFYMVELFLLFFFNLSLFLSSIFPLLLFFCVFIYLPCMVFIDSPYNPYTLYPRPKSDFPLENPTLTPFKPGHSDAEASSSARGISSFQNQFY